jgi:hypothetical protein
MYSEKERMAKAKKYPTWALKKIVEDKGIFGQRGNAQPRFHKATKKDVGLAQQVLNLRRN